MGRIRYTAREGGGFGRVGPALAQLAHGGVGLGVGQGLVVEKLGENLFHWFLASSYKLSAASAVQFDVV